MIVKTVKTGRGSVLIEWEEAGRIKRGWIPDNLINKDLEVTPRTLREATPYGVPFERILKSVTITPTDLADALRRRHVWTEYDLTKNPEAISRAIIAACVISVSKIQTAVRDFGKSEVTDAE